MFYLFFPRIPCVPHSGGISRFCNSPAELSGEGGEECEERGSITPISYMFSLLATLVERFHAGANGNAFSKRSLKSVSSTFMLCVEPALVATPVSLP